MNHVLLLDWLVWVYRVQSKIRCTNIWLSTSAFHDYHAWIPLHSWFTSSGLTICMLKDFCLCCEWEPGHLILSCLHIHLSCDFLTCSQTSCSGGESSSLSGLLLCFHDPGHGWEGLKEVIILLCKSCFVGSGPLLVTVTKRQRPRHWSFSRLCHWVCWKAQSCCTYSDFLQSK